MKYIKRFNENKNVEEVCNKYGIENWSIVDGKVNVEGDVRLVAKKLKSLDIFNTLSFGEVTGHFYCHRNQLTSLKYAPNKVGGNFYCDNNELTSLEYAPTLVGRDFNCRNNKLISLQYAPLRVGGNFICRLNDLTSLEGAPSHVVGDFDCSVNDLTSLYGAPSHVGGSFYCTENELTSLKHAPITVDGDFNCLYNNILDFKYLSNIDGDIYLNTQLLYLFDNYINKEDKIQLFNEFDIIRGKKINLKRLNKFIMQYGGDEIDTDMLEELGYEF